MHHETVAEHFTGYFTLDEYDGSYARSRKMSGAEDQARADFFRLTDNYLIWTQVHGDYKDRAKAARFKPYEHWPQLYESCKRAVAAHSTDAFDCSFNGSETCAKIMDTAMRILKMEYGLNAPKWWLPLIYQLRGKPKYERKGATV
jgi:hypothetical protein